MARTTLTSEQKAELMEVFKEPRTIQEVADMFGVNYFTIHRKAKILREEGILREMPWRRDGAMLFCIGRTRVDGVATVVSGRSGKALTLHELIDYFQTGLPTLSARAVGALCQTYMRTYGAATSQTHLRGTVDTVTTRAVLQNVRDNLMAAYGLVEQVLLLNMWDDNNADLIDLWGPTEEIASYVELALRFHTTLDEERSRRSSSTETSDA